MEFENIKLKEFCSYLKNKKVAILGIENNSLSLLDFLIKIDAKVTVFDYKNIEEIEDSIMHKISDNGIKFSFGENSLSRLIGFDIIFRGENYKPNLPEIVDELNRGTILTSEIEMYMELFPGKTIGITGSKGKTTIVNLIYEMLMQKGYSCYKWQGIFENIFNMSKEDILILEIKSGQLINMKTSPQIAVVTNVIHKYMYEDTIQYYKNIFKYQEKDDILVLNFDDETVREYEKEAVRTGCFL